MIHFDNFSISKREVIISIAIVAIMLVFGFMIHSSINDKLMLEYQKYNTALQINNDSELFKYSLKTNVGNVFAYGELQCIDTVTYPEIGGEYSYVKKVKERYTEHTRTVTRTETVNGKTQTHTEIETYWSWDQVSSESKHCNKISFLGVEFDYGQINFPASNHIDTIKTSSYIRYVYYGAPSKCTGTLYSNLKNNTINDSKFYSNQDIARTIEILESGGELILFWFAWIAFMCVLVFAFIYVDNHWLEDKPKYKTSHKIFN